MQSLRQIHSSPPPRSGGFAERLQPKQGNATHLIRTYDHEGKACWFFMKADLRNLTKLGSTQYEQIVDLKDFGEVVASGWGHTPPVHY